MRVDGGRGKLYDVQKKTRQRWEELCEIWNDPVRQHFQETIWEPLDDVTSEYLRSIDQLSQVFHQLRRECGGDDLILEG